MNTISKGLAIGCALMGFACLTEDMPVFFVQHMQGLILFLMAMIFWTNPWRDL